MTTDQRLRSMILPRVCLAATLYRTTVTSLGCVGMATCSVCGSAAPEAARFCPSCAAPMEQGRETPERKLATVIFADLVGSTAMAGSQDPERTRMILERFYDSMAGEIEAAGGTVEKFAGDAVMAAFGAPAALEDHAERALHAAIAMQRRLHEIGGDLLALRIGVNSGEVVTGAPREGSSFVSGDPVNVAARLEQAAEPGEIVVGERTVALARGAFEFAEPTTVDAKGKPGGVVCRRLVRALSLMRPRGVAGLRRTFVGRDDELTSLERAYADAVASRSPRLVTILGDAGVGKTRLVREFWERLGDERPEPLRRTGRCLSYGDGVTYWPLAEVLREQTGMSENDPAPAVLEALGDRPILGLALGLDVARDLHPLVARDRFQDAWVQLVGELAADRPVVLLIEDIHWAEDLLLDLLERLVSDTSGPFLLLATARPEVLEHRPGWGARAPSTAIALEALSAGNAEAMLDGLLGGDPPEGLRDVVVGRAEGNPFFVEEVIGTLMDLGLLRREDAGWRLAQLPADFAVPDTIHAVVAARVDLLEADDKEGLQAASVIGRIFWAAPVYELVHGATPDLHTLEERDFIRRRSGSSIAGDREYAIKHALTREVAYGTLPKARRAHMHASFARWLEAEGLGRDEFASLLAHHYAEAVRPDDVDLAWAGRDAEVAELRSSAVSWLRQAADLAVGRMEVEDAVALLYRAVELEPDPERRADLLHAIGRASLLRYDGEGFWNAMQASLEATSDPAVRADVEADLAFHTALRSGMWLVRPEDALIEGWFEGALAVAAPGSAARAKALLARSFVEPAGSEGHVEEALAIADALGDLELRSFAYDGHAGAAMARGEYQEAAAWVDRRLALVPELSDPDHISLVFGYSIDALVSVGRMDDARRIAHAYDDATRTMSPHHRLHAVAGIMTVDTDQGRWASVRDHAAWAETAVAANTQTPCALEDVVLLSAALAHVHLGDDTEARRLEAIVESLGREGFRMRRHLDAQIAIARHDLEGLERLLGEPWLRGLEYPEIEATHLDALVALGRRDEVQEEAPPLVIEGSYIEPFSLRALGWATNDDERIRRAIERFEALDMTWHAERTAVWLT
jgi:class 3 adenylate cyclase/tetratricopeptide (TPR) repeat protein